MRALALFLLRFYQYFISPLLGPRCRFYPSCSNYALICFSQFSFFKALWYTIQRLSKCQVFHPGGIDNPPQVK